MAKIAIDGPAGAGKSTIAKAVAGQLGWIYVDTGAMYRAIGLAALRKKISISQNQQAVKALLPSLDIQLRHENGSQRIFLQGEDVSEAIRSPEASIAASDVSAIASVREFLLSQQREIARRTDVVMDGRDIGTVVLPDAQVKLFVTASARARAERRYHELFNKGRQVSLQQVLNDIKYRDEQDSNRSVAPLKMADDAVLVDTTKLTLEQSIQTVMKIIQERL